ncbi:MAG: hypothetical protein JW841_17820 [Deltaproteobacteria bacterium]|nr:hypothetical protein [Deltaproteobacteria bacterium]
MKQATILCLFTLFISACEDGPKANFKPNHGDVTAQNGYTPQSSFNPDESKTFETTATADDSGRFCNTQLTDQVVQQMMQLPIIPDVGLGDASQVGVPLWAADGTPMNADDLIGSPDDGKFCYPTGVYANAYAYGPLYEIIVYFDPATKLISDIDLGSGYIGNLQGQYIANDDSLVTVVIHPRDQILIGSQALDTYASSANQAASPNSWLNHTRINQIYRMLRHTFFSAVKFADNDDCITANICEVIYAGVDEATPQDTAIVFKDSGVIIDFNPDGSVYDIDISAVKVAPFEVSTQISMVYNGAVDPLIVSTSVATCSLYLGLGVNAMTFADFKSNCLEADDTRTLSRVSYSTGSQRDAITADFNGISLGFQRNLAAGQVILDGERPADSDSLKSITYTRSLGAPVIEFIPSEIGIKFDEKLRVRINTLVDPTHLFFNYALDLVSADLSDSPQPIGALSSNGSSWIAYVLQLLQYQYSLLPANQQPAVAKVLDPIFVIEPFVDAVMAQLTDELSDDPDYAVKLFETTDNKRWVIGRAYMQQDGVPYRLAVQYSLNYGAVTAVTIQIGGNTLDSIYAAHTTVYNSLAPYYYLPTELYFSAGMLANLWFFPLSLGQTGITVNASNRQLGTLDISIANVKGWSGTVDDNGDPILVTEPLLFTVPGTSIEDMGGYYKQVGGEQFEFVPSYDVQLYGKDSLMSFHVIETVDSEGAATQVIDQVAQNYFKAPQMLCAGPASGGYELMINVGDDVREKIITWIAGDDYIRDCDLVFNYSANGNVLTSVTSLNHKVSFGLSGGRAVSVSYWR